MRARRRCDAMGWPAGSDRFRTAALYRFAYPNMIINLVWITFGFYALLRTFRRRCHAAAEDAETGPNEAAVPSALEVSIGKPRRDR